ncbi:hypothetical protein EVAR_50881_1 [Eumeta japonica]|uniref:Uncharacterized protein n=1 Tax=Eumeta variegata TaxID=151549 RepID=A0A4C1Y7A4_EUMVA|nr:hypothetical protein EVAR_50881_1 [Eumeta japonica]
MSKKFLLNRARAASGHRRDCELVPTSHVGNLKHARAARPRVTADITLKAATGAISTFSLRPEPPASTLT